MKVDVYVLYGGKSVEHEVSLLTALSIINALNKEKYNVYPIYITKNGIWYNKGLVRETIKDVGELKNFSTKSILKSIAEDFLKKIKANTRTVIFPALHGTNGEDGTIQGLLELLDVPYVGNGIMASAVGFDKAMMKELFSKANVPQAQYEILDYQEWIKSQKDSYVRLEEAIGYPCFVKPARLGSSVGINRCGNIEELKEAINEAFFYDIKLVIEKEIIGREMQISVIGNESPKSSVIGEFIQEKPFMDYSAKYLDGKLIPVIPARLSDEITSKMQETALKIFKLLNCNGLARVDYFVSHNDKFFVNEINTMPGFTKASMTPVLWEKTDGTSYQQLIEKLIEYAFERHEKKGTLLYDRRII